MSRYLDPQDTFRLVEGRPASYFKLGGITNSLTNETDEDCIERIFEALSRVKAQLRFVFVKDPGRLTDIATWNGNRDDHPLCVSTRDTLNLHLEHAQRQTVYEACYLEISTGPAVVDTWRPQFDEHNQVVKRISHAFDNQIFDPCRWADFDTELSRPGLVARAFDGPGNNNPSSFKSFAEFISLAKPWRMTLMIDSDSVKATKQAKRTALASQIKRLFLGKTCAPNPYDSLLDDLYVDDHLVTTQLQFETWGPTVVDELSNLKQLSSAISAAGLLRLHQAPVMRLRDAVRLMPISRPGSPWNSGEITFRTADAKLFPYAQLSHSRSSLTEVVFHQSDEDAETYHRAMNMGLIAQGKEQPMIARIKIGAGPDLSLDWVKKTFSDSAKGLVAEFEATPDHAFCVNIFDTEPGSRTSYEAVQEAATLLNVLLDSPNTTYDHSFMHDLLLALVNEAFDKCSDSKEPKAYNPSDSPTVAAALASAGLRPTTWWEAADRLQAAGLHREGDLAQRHAVPVLPDLVWILRNDPIIRIRYGLRLVFGSSALVIDALAEMLESVVLAWPSLAAPTTFDSKGSEITTIRVLERHVVGNLSQDQITCALYLLARKVVSAPFFHTSLRYGFCDLHEDNAHFLQRYKLEQRDLMKKVCYSNVDRVINNPHVWRQLVGDLRDCRKLGVMVSLDSRSFSVPRDVCALTANLALLSPEALSQGEWAEFSSIGMPKGQKQPSCAPGGLNVLFTASLAAYNFTVRQHLVLIDANDPRT